MKLVFALIAATASMSLSSGQSTSAPANNLENDPPLGTLKMFNAFNTDVVDHFYSTNKTEVDYLISYYGFKLEGPRGTSTGYLHTSHQPDTVPLFRLYSIGRTDHLYTTSAQERDLAMKRYGYTPEGTLGYVYTSEGSGRVPLYRLFNPQRHDHYYTTSPREREDASRNGWADEGTVGYIHPS